MNEDTGQQHSSEASVEFVQDYGQDNELQSMDVMSVEKLVRRVEELQRRIDKQFLTVDDGNHKIDYDLIEHMSREIEVIAQKIETLPVTSLAIAKMKISFFMNMLRSDHPDPIKVDIFTNKILGAFAKYASSERVDDYQTS